MKIGRNEACPCGSGKKYKNCCYGKDISSIHVDTRNDSPFKTGRTVHNEDAWITNYDQESLSLPQQFISKHYYPDFHVVFADYNQNECIYISNPVSEIKDKIGEITCLVSSSEHTFIESIVVDSYKKIYILKIQISRGHFDTRFQYRVDNGQLLKTYYEVPETVFTDFYADTARQDIRCPIVNLYDEDISSLRNYEMSEMLSVIGDGELENEIRLTELCITKIEQCFNTELVGERTNLKLCRYDLKNKTKLECARIFTDWRKGMVDVYSGKICTAEQLDYYYGMDECMNSLPILALPDVHQLSTFYESIIQQFPIKGDMKYVMPFDNYAVKVSDKDGQTVYVVIHKRVDHYELVGLAATSNSFSKSNLDYIALRPNSEMNMQYEIGLLGIGKCDNNGYSAPCIKVPFDYLDDFAKYSKAYRQALRGYNKPKTNAYKYWSDLAIEYAGGTEDVVADLQCPSVDVLLLHVWLHSLALYNILLNTRQIEIVKPSGLLIESRNTTGVKNLSNRCVIDLGQKKRIYVYDNEEEREQICRKYHIFSTNRRGHLRHYKNGEIIYISPQVINYSNLADDAHKKNNENTYRNSEDFLQEKSYLEFDMDTMLRSHNIEYKREVSSTVFPWIGRKRLDFYLPSKKIAIECQGVQHFYRYGGSDTIEKLEERKKRDIEKYQQCEEHGIMLIYYVSPDIPLPDWVNNKYLYFTDLDELYEMIVL